VVSPGQTLRISASCTAGYRALTQQNWQQTHNTTQLKQPNKLLLYRWKKSADRYCLAVGSNIGRRPEWHALNVQMCPLSLEVITACNTVQTKYNISRQSSLNTYPISTTNVMTLFLKEHLQGGPAKVRPTYILLVTFGTWLIEQCFTSTPTQCRLYGRRVFGTWMYR